MSTAAGSARLIEDGDEHDDSGDDDDGDDFSAAVSEQLAEADMDTRMDEDDTPVDTNARPPSPRDFLRRNSTETVRETETLVYILTISSPNEASDTLPRLEWASVTVLS